MAKKTGRKIKCLKQEGFALGHATVACPFSELLVGEMEAQPLNQLKTHKPKRMAWNHQDQHVCICLFWRVPF